MKKLKYPFYVWGPTFCRVAYAPDVVYLYDSKTMGLLSTKETRPSPEILYEYSISPTNNSEWRLITRKQFYTFLRRGNALVTQEELLGLGQNKQTKTKTK